jgi:integrase
VLKGAHTLTQARTLRAAELQKVEKAKVLGYTPPGKESFGEIVERYLKYQLVRLTAKAYERTNGVVRKLLLPVFGPSRLASIRRQDVQNYMTERAAKVGPASVTKELNILKHLLSMAVQWELLPFNPASGVKAPRQPAGRVRYLQPGELRAVLAACPDWLRPIAGFAAFTAMRRSEILGLRWMDIDRKGGRILLPQTKNGEGRIVYLNALASKVVDSLSEGAVQQIDKVFPVTEEIPATPGNVSVKFLRTCRAVGIPDFHFHDLRHTCASWLRMSGADIHTVALLLGHKDLRMAARYQHLSPAYLQDAVQRLDSVFGEPLQLAGSA